MSLNLDFVFAEPQFAHWHHRGESEQRESVQVIGEILPFALARYGIELQPPPRRCETAAMHEEVLRRT